MDIKKKVKEEVDLILEFILNWDEISNEEDVKNIALLSGLPSITILLLDYYTKFPSINLKLKIKEYVIKSIDIIEVQDKIFPSYCAGLAGYGFFLLKLKQTDILSEDIEILNQIDEISNQIDEILEEQIDIDFLDDNFDILHGVLGVGLYFLERDKLSFVDKIVDKLVETSFSKEDQIYWKKYDKFKAVDSIIDMGNAHGNSSIIYFLSKILSKNPKNEQVKELIKKSINFYLNNCQELNDEIYSYFPHQIITKEFDEGINKPGNSRFAWCYGDLGVLNTLLMSSKLIEDDKMYLNILDKLKNIANRKYETEVFTIDAGFCHGSSGIAIIFNKIHKLTGIKTFSKESEYWVNITLGEKNKSNNSIKNLGYSFPINDNKNHSLTLLEGLAGLLFCYLNFLYDDMPFTEETLLIKF